MLQVFSMPCGFLQFDSKLFFPNLEKGELFTVPVPSYLITHPKGNVVFDTGVHCQAIHDPVSSITKKWTASTTSSATAPWYSFPPTATRQGISRSVFASPKGLRSFSLGTLATPRPTWTRICCRQLCLTRRKCPAPWGNCATCATSKGRRSSTGTTRSSGKRSRTRQSRWRK